MKPNQVFGQDQVIPHDVLKRAKGLAIITVFKAGFLFSGRAGSGVIVARLRDGSWSAPSAIAMAGAGAGGMVGIELTDFVFILNDEDAVRSFSEFGTITLGGNVSVAAGPLGRNAEASAAASTGGVAAVFAYSKTKGLFAGVSVEGSVILERREANRKFYGNNCTSKMILAGRVRPPPSVDPLFRVLESRAFNYRSTYNDEGDEDGYSTNDSRFYDDIPDSFDSSSVGGGRSRGYSRGSVGRNGSRSNRYDDEFDDFDNDDDDDYYNNNRTSGNNNTSSRNRRSYNRDSKPNFDSDDFDQDSNSASNYYATHKSPLSAHGGSKSRWEDDVYDRQRSSTGRRSGDSDVNDLSNQFSKARISSTPGTSAAAARSPRLGSSGAPKAVALYSFSGEEADDLPFRKGDVITILKKSESQNDWWTGRVNGREGIFPANYVELV